MIILDSSIHFWNKNKIAFKYKKQSSIYHKILDMSICNASSRHVHQQNENTNVHQGPWVTNTSAHFIPEQRKFS